MQLKKQTIGRVSFAAAILILLSSVFLFGSCGKSEEAEPTSKAPVCEIVVKGFGSITVTLDGEAAPITVNHFLKLAESGAYDGSVFTRVQVGYFLQGGQGAKDNSTIKGEFSSNGVDNPLKHKKGVISMARATDPNSASSQFFITLSDVSSLDGDYAAFGSVTDGWDTVEKIVSSVGAADCRNDYYGTAMGFLNESSYITIETVKVISK